MVVTVYSDRTFTFITKTPPAAILLKRAAGIAKGSGTPNKDKVGKVTEKQVLEIAKQKMPDLNAASLEAAVKSVKGTARSMGLKYGVGFGFARSQSMSSRKRQPKEASAARSAWIRQVADTTVVSPARHKQLARWTRRTRARRL